MDHVSESSELSTASSGATNSDESRRGRPAGGGQNGYKQCVSESVVIPSVCRMCGSTERTNYKNIRRHEHDGIETEWKDCYCADCGQRRTDIFKTKTAVTEEAR